MYLVTFFAIVVFDIETNLSRHMWKTLLSFSAKTMTEIEVISQKPSKTGFLAKTDHFLTLFGPKKSPILDFPTDTTTHTR